MAPALDPLTRLWTSLSEGLLGRARLSSSDFLPLAFFGTSITCLAVVHKQRAKRLQAVSERSVVGNTALAQLSLERRSTLTYAPETLASANPTGPSLPATDSTATATAPRGNFFKFRPPVRTAPAPEALKLDRVVVAASSAESAAAVAPPETPISSETTSDDPRGIGLSANVTTRRESYSTRQQPADFADSDSDSGNSSDSTLDNKSRGVQFVDSDSDSDSADSAGSESDSRGGNSRPSRFGVAVGAGGGGDAAESKAGMRGVRRTSTPGGVGILSPAAVLPQQGWKSQFVVSVSKWEYNDAGDVVYTVQSNYTQTNFWTVRRTYGQFVAWFDSLGGATGELKDVKSPWPAAEFVLFYMPVEAINKVSPQPVVFFPTLVVPRLLFSSSWRTLANLAIRTHAPHHTLTHALSRSIFSASRSCTPFSPS